MAIDTKKFKIKKTFLNDAGIKQFLLDAPESIGILNIEDVECKITPSGNKHCYVIYSAQDFIFWLEMRYYNNISSIRLLTPSKLLTYNQIDYKNLDVSLIKQENYLHNTTQEMLKKLNEGWLLAGPEYMEDCLL